MKPGRSHFVGHLLTLPLLLSLGACVTPRDRPPGEAWQLSWSDEFEGERDALPDPARWTYDIGGDGWGNEQLEFDTDRPENVSLDGEGHLRIVAREESYQGRDYTSARILTRGLFEQQGGRIEARIKLPRGQGIWPAFWMLGADFPETGWPDCGEIDIMEYRGQDPQVVHGSLHGPGFSGANPISASYRLESGGFDEDFHVFAVEWDPGRIAFLIDDEVYNIVTSAQVPEGGRWVFEHPFFLILNLAVGGHFVGAPDATTLFPQTLLVDWVRVYQRG